MTQPANPVVPNPISNSAPATGRGAADPLAVVGIALRIPGSDSVEQFESALLNQRSCIGAFPKERFDLVVGARDELAEQYRGQWEKLSSDPRAQGGWLRGIERFDPEAFGLDAYTAQFMGPSERIFLEVADEALVRAGYRRSKLRGSKTGVFVGHTPYPGYEYLELFDDVDERAFISNIPANLGYHLAYLLDLRGPVLTVNTACSSSLAALHQAKYALRAGECDAAVVAGINLSLFPFWGKSPDHLVRSSNYRCAPYDATADGIVGGEGVIAIVVKRLSDAVANGDHVHAVIRGSAMGSDGASNGMQAPNPLAQAEVIRAALADAGVSAADLGYVEGHGTGTRLGDMVEVDALTQAFAADAAPVGSCRLGSVKANVGHLGDAAGLAGLLAAVLNVEHGVIAGLAGLTEPNPFIDFASSPFVVSGENTRWHTADGAPRRAGVSSFGISGTNVHVIVEEYRAEATGPSDTGHAHPVLLSGRSRWELWELVQRLSALLEQSLDPHVADIAHTFAVRRAHHGVRIGVFATDTADLAAKLQRLLTVRTFEKVPEDFPAAGVFVVDEEEMRAHAADDVDRYRGTATDADLALMRAFVTGADVTRVDPESSAATGRALSLPAVVGTPRRIWPGADSASNAAVDVSDLFFTARWVGCVGPARPDPAFTADGNVWVVLGRPGDRVVTGVLDRLADAGARVVLATPGTGFARTGEDVYELDITCAEDYAALWADLGDEATARLKGIVHALTLAAVDSTADGTRSTDGVSGLKQTQRDGVYAVFHLAQSLLALGLDHPLRFAVATSRVEEVLPGEPSDPARVTAFGVAKVLSQEWPTAAEVLIDHDLDGSPESVAEQIANELTCAADSRREQVAYRVGRRLTKQVERGGDAGDGESAREFVVRDGGTYVVAGGTGYLGMQVGLFLARRGAGTVVLISRRGLPDRSRWEDLAADNDPDLAYQAKSLLAIEAAGCTVVAPVCDMTDPDAVAETFAGIRAAHGPIHGGFMLTKQLYHKWIGELDYRDFVKGIENRVLGAWLLQRELAGPDLDFLVLFSSISSLMGTKGASECCAVNQYLDALAGHLSTRGVPTGALNLTLILDDPGVFANKTAIPPIDFAQFQASLARFFRDGHRFDLVAAFDLEQVHLLRPVMKIPFSDAMWAEAQAHAASVGAVAGAASRNPTGRQGAAAPDAAGLDEAAVRALVAGLWQRTIGDEAPGGGSFFTAGGTSLTALRFVKLFREALPDVPFDVADLYAKPGYAEQVGYVLDRLGLGTGADPAGAADAADGAGDGLDLDALLDAVVSGELSGEDAAGAYRRSIEGS